MERGNKILAYFMQVEYNSELNYHEDWNKLMMVWKKLLYGKNMKERNHIDKISNTILEVNITETWGLIVGYINKYILTEEEYLKFIDNV